MFWLRNKKNNFQLHTLIWGLILLDLLDEFYSARQESYETQTIQGNIIKVWTQLLTFLCGLYDIIYHLPLRVTIIKLL